MSAQTIGETEEVDVVVVGARVAGAPAATELARMGRRVIALDAATFPSDTLSTHVIFPGCVAEIQALGLLDTLLATGSPQVPGVHIDHGGHVARGRFTPVDGIDYAMCPRRTNLDHVLITGALAAGVDVREATSLTDLVWAGGRVVGVRWKDREGRVGEIRSRLVVGADGRRSTVAQLVGAKEPYRWAENGRGLVFAYVDDPMGPEDRKALFQWRVGDTLGMYFPTDDQGGLVLFMGPKEDVSGFGQDLRTWNVMVDRNRLLKERIAGGALRTKLRKAADTFSYFRRSSGPGWALVGDAGHFKDPVIAQGIRDAIVYGRRLGRVAGESLDDVEWLDRRLYRWELDRDRECMPSYYFGLRQTRTHPVTPIEVEMFRDLESQRALADELADVFGRTRELKDLASYRRQARWVTRAMRRPDTDRRASLAEGRAEFAFDLALRRDLVRLARGQRVNGSTGDPWSEGSSTASRASTATATTAPTAQAYVRPTEPQTSDVDADPSVTSHPDNGATNGDAAPRRPEKATRA